MKTYRLLMAMSLLPIAPAAFAEACETGQAEVVEEGQMFLVLEQQLLEVQQLLISAQADYDQLAAAIDQQGPSADPDGDLERLAQDVMAFSAEWEVARGLLLEGESRLRAAIAAHETACGANARSDAILTELGITRNS